MELRPTVEQEQASRSRRPNFRSCNTSLFVCEIRSVLVCWRVSVFWLFSPTDPGSRLTCWCFLCIWEEQKDCYPWGSLQAEESSEVTLGRDWSISEFFNPQSVPPFRLSTWWGGVICPPTSVSSTRTAPKPWKGWWPTASRSPRMRGRSSRRCAVVLVIESQLNSSFNDLFFYFCLHRFCPPSSFSSMLCLRSTAVPQNRPCTEPLTPRTSTHVP